MNRAVLGLATDQGAMVLKPAAEATAYTIAARGLMNRKCHCITRSGDGMLAVGTDDFFVQTSKDGLEWKTCLNGLTHSKITSLARHPQHKHLLFAGTSSPAVYLSKDHGVNWERLAALESLPSVSRWTAEAAPFRAKVTGVTCHSEHTGVLFAAIHIGGLAASKDGGQSWFARDKDLPADLRVIIAPPVTSRLYAGTKTGFFRTDDMGGTWVEKTKGFPYKAVSALAVAGSNPELLVAAVSGSPDGMAALLQTKDGGENWEVIDKGLPPINDRVITAIKFGRGGFYAGTNKGDLFGLDNLEGRWTILGSKYPPINAITCLA